MYNYIKTHWLDWFPQLPTYETFVNRINRICDVFPVLVSHLTEALDTSSDKVVTVLTDSMPIITCSHKRRAKVALDLVDKGYCSTKNLHYFGVKLHLVAQSRPKRLPVPEYIGITPASTHDLTALRPVLHTIQNRNIIADKAYIDQQLNQDLINNHNSQIVTPIKDKKGTPLVLKQFDQAFNDLFSTAVSKIRQPVESFFSWLQEKTKIQFASKIRSKQGLIVHVYGKIAAAIITWIIS